MQLTINGEAREIDDSLTVEQLIERLGMQGRRLAVEINQEILPRSRFVEHRLSDGDRIEIVRAIGGG